MSIEHTLKAPCRLPGAPPPVANEAFEPAGYLDAEAGCGLAAFGGRGVVKPFACLALPESRARIWRIGVRWTLGPDIGFGVEGSRRETGNDETVEHDIECRATMRW